MRKRTYWGARSYTRPREVIVSIANNPNQGVAMILLLAAFSVVFVLGGICIWPYFISKAFAEGSLDMQSVFGKAVVIGGISCVIGLLISAYFSWFYEWDEERRFSFPRVFLIVYSVLIFANWLLMIIFHMDILGSLSNDAWTGILSVLCHGILGMLMALLPSLLAAIAGYTANLLWYLTHKHML